MQDELINTEAGKISARLAVLRERMEGATVRSNRKIGEVKLVAVSKTHGIETLRAAMNLGLKEFGENRIQEAQGKIEELRGLSLNWHLIGKLQANKARRAVKLFDVIETVESVELVKRLERLCAEEGRPELPIFVQVDLGGEVTKSGASVEELPGVMEAALNSTNLRLRGLMTLPPFFEDTEAVRPFFRRLRELRDEWRLRGAFGDEEGELSMGMSHDFEVAIEEGATYVRVGTALFGERPPMK